MRTPAAFLPLLAVVLAGCVAASGNGYPLPAAQRATSIYVVAQGWHTEIVIRRADIASAVWPESADFPTAAYLAVGWGDRDYYPATEFNFWYGFKALFWPTASVLHVVGLDNPPRLQFPYDEVVELWLSREGVERLSAYIGASYDRDGAARAQPLLPSPYGAGWFYPSHEKFHLFKTCNVWVARALQAAGVPVRAFLALTTGSVMRQVRDIGAGCAIAARGARMSRAAESGVCALKNDERRTPSLALPLQGGGLGWGSSAQVLKIAARRLPAAPRRV